MLTGHARAPPPQPWPRAGRSFTGGVSDSVLRLHTEPCPHSVPGVMDAHRTEARAQVPGETRGRCAPGAHHGRPRLGRSRCWATGPSHHRCGRAGLCTHFPGSLSPLVSPDPASAPPPPCKAATRRPGSGKQGGEFGHPRRGEDPLCKWTDIETEGRFQWGWGHIAALSPASRGEGSAV